MDVTSFYDQRALKTEINQKKVDLVLGFLEEYQNGLLLDIGCGDGTVSRQIAHTTHGQIVGLDISASVLEMVRFDTSVCNIEEGLPFVDSVFDACHLGEVIEHIFDTDFLLSEIWRVLKPGGYCIVTTPNLAYWVNRLFLLVGFQPLAINPSLKHYGLGNPLARQKKHVPAGHIRGFTLAALKDLVEINGFTCEQAKSSPKLSGVLFTLDKFIARLFPSLGGNLVLKIRKPT